MNIQITKKILCLFALLLMTNLAFSQVVVKDKKHRNWSKIMEEVQVASQAINTRVTAFVENIKDVQSFMSKAATVVNGVVQNLRLIRKIIEIEKEIAELTRESIRIINSPRDADGDGVDDLEFLDKNALTRWKQVQILLAISSEAQNVFDLFKNVIEKDATIMDDKGRLTLIREAYQDALKIKVSIKIQLRRINREVYQFQRLKKEIQVYDALFSTN